MQHVKVWLKDTPIDLSPLLYDANYLTLEEGFLMLSVKSGNGAETVAFPIHNILMFTSDPL